MPRGNLVGVAACSQIAARQHGLISRQQAQRAGLSPDAIDRLIAESAWQRVRPAVFALWVPSADEDLWRHRLTAAALWLGDRAAVSHLAAGILHEVDGVASAALEFSTTGRRRAKSPGLVIHRVLSLPSDDVMLLGGIRVTTTMRTIIDLAGVLDGSGLEAVIESMLRKGVVTIEQIDEARGRSSRTTPGRGLLADVLDTLPSIRTESYLETLIWQYLRLVCVPMPERQYRIRDEDGRVLARIDFAFPDARLAVEADGYEHHWRPKDWKRDRSRQNALLRLGWETYRITWEDVATAAKGRQMAADVVKIVRARTARRNAG